MNRPSSVTEASRTRALLACDAIGGLLFILDFLLEGAARAGYDPHRLPVSALSIGDRGWIQVANFIVTGLLMLAFAMGLRRAFRLSGGPFLGPSLVAFFGIGLIGSGLFIADRLNGYPPGTPLMPVEMSIQGDFTIS